MTWKPGSSDGATSCRAILMNGTRWITCWTTTACTLTWARRYQVRYPVMADSTDDPPADFQVLVREALEELATATPEQIDALRDLLKEYQEKDADGGRRPHGGGLYPRPDRSRQGRRCGLADRQAHRSHAGGGRHRALRRHRPRPGRQRRRTRPAGRRAHPVRAGDHQDAHLPRGAHLSSSAASGALRGPRPSRTATRRSSGVSTSRRSPGM